MTSAQDRARAVLTDLDSNDLSFVTISDVEIISQQIDRYDGMHLLRAFGACLFAHQTKGIPQKAKDASAKELRLHLHRVIGN